MFRFCAALLFFVTAGCSTPIHKAFSRLSQGQDKSQVLDALGSPKHTARSGSRDFWVYRYYKDGVEYKRTLTFDQGKLEVVGMESAIHDPREDAIDQDLENLAPAPKKGSFKTIN